MMLRKIALILLVISLSSFVLSAQNQGDVSVEKINDQLYKIKSIRAANRISHVIVFTGDEGALVIDAGYSKTSQKIDSVVRELTGNNIKYLVSTHYHLDHLGASGLIGKDAIVIGHENLRKELTSGIKLLQDIPETAIPEITFKDSLNIHLNGEEIQLIYLADGHTNSDIIIYFKNMGILCMGDILAADILPFAELRKGARLLQHFNNVNSIIERFPDTTLFIGGHGRNYTKSDFKEHIEKLTKSFNVVLDGLKQGKSVEQMQEEKVLQDWEYMAKGAVTTDYWIEMIAYCEENKVHIQKKSLIDPIYHSFHKENLRAAIEKYKYIKENKFDEYSFNENALVYFGYYLIRNEKPEDAVELLEFNVEEYPESLNTYECLAQAFKLSGNIKKAKISYKKALELDPGNERIKEAIKKLENR